jgi:hypothetical protein
MAKRRRGRGQGSANPNNQNQNQGNQNHQGGGGGGGGQNHGHGHGQQGQGQGRRQGDSAARFWGDPATKRAEPTSIRPTPDPAALVKSLGNPPLSPTASHQLAVVYEEAVRAATALAAANGLLDVDELD